MNSKITHEQLQEWTDNPVTTHLKERLVDYLDDLEKVKGPSCYAAYEPQKTQENLAQLVGKGTAITDVLNLLEGDWMSLSTGEDRDEQYLRYLSEGE